MHPFFELIESVGIRQTRVAGVMGYSPEAFSRIKNGQDPLSPRFIRRAVDACRLLRLFRETGEPYTSADLFLPTVSDVMDESFAEVS